MEGFSGPFDFRFDGIIHSWKDLDDYTIEKLEITNFTRENSNIHICKVCVFPTVSIKQKNHNWAKVKRVFFNLTLPSKDMSIIGIYPTNRHKELLNEKSPFKKSVMSKSELFKMTKDHLTIYPIVKTNSRSDRFIVMANYNQRQAQWVFSEGWEGLDFQLYLYIAVLKKTPEVEKTFIFRLNAPERRIKCSEH